MIPGPRPLHGQTSPGGHSEVPTRLLAASIGQPSAASRISRFGVPHGRLHCPQPLHPHAADQGIGPRPHPLRKNRANITCPGGGCSAL